MKTRLAWLVALSTLVTGSALTPLLAYGQMDFVHMSYGRVMNPAATATATTQPNIPYNGGQVLPNSTTYAIFWGSPADFPPDYVSGIDQFLTGLDGSQYLAIADQYMLGSTTTTQFGGNLFDTSSPPPAVPSTGSHSGSDIGTHVCQFLHASNLTPDPKGVYLLYTSNYPPDAITGAVGYCAFHGTQICTQTNGGSAVLHVAYVPNMTSVNECDVDFLYHPLLAPNSYSQGTRSAVDGTAHEFMETISDPNGDGWIATDGSEVADLCNGLYQNWVPIGAGRWQIQQIWSNEDNGCSQGGGTAVSLLGASSSSSSVSKFTIPGATYGVFGLGINNSGEIAGTYSNTNSGTVFSGFLRTAQGTVSPINVPGAAITLIWAINDSGTTAGVYSASGTEEAGLVAHAFVRSPAGTITSFDPTTNSIFPGVSGINNPGAVIGFYVDESGLTHAFVRDPSGNITTFDASGQPYQTIPLSINDGGWITGFFDSLNQPFHGFVRDSAGNITTFDVPGGVNGTQPMAINANGAIVGTYTDANFVRHAFTRDPLGTIRTFDAPNAKYATVAQSINKYGEIAGYFSDANAVSYGFVRDASGNFTILTAIPYSINNSGATAGYAAVPLKK